MALRPSHYQMKLHYFSTALALIALALILLLSGCDSYKSHRPTEPKRSIEQNTGHSLNKHDIRLKAKAAPDKSAQAITPKEKALLSKEAVLTSKGNTSRTLMTPVETEVMPLRSATQETKEGNKRLDLSLDRLTLSSIQKACKDKVNNCLDKGKPSVLPDLFSLKEQDSIFNISGDVERDAEKELLDIKAITGGEVSIEYKFK